MPLRNIEYFLTIADCGSITKAAELLFISQPSLSQYLKRLESELGVTLLERSRTPMPLTEAGKRYYEYVLRIRQMNKDLSRELEDIQREDAGTLRLGVAFWRSACLLPDTFPSFHKEYPNIRIELLEGHSAILEDALLKDKIDVALVNLPRNMNYSELSCEFICEERILLAAPTQHPYVQELLRKGRYIDGHPVAPLAILNEIPVVLTKKGQNLTLEVEYALGKNHIEPNLLMETSNNTTAINLTAKGMCCAFVPEEGAKVCQHPGFVTYFVIDSPDLVWDLAAVYRKNAYLPKYARIFIDSLKEQLGSQDIEK